MKKGHVVMFVLLAAIGITAALFLQIAEEKKSIQTTQRQQIDQTRRIALARIDMEIEEAQEEATHAKIAFDLELKANAQVTSAWGPQLIRHRMEVLDAATAEYGRTSRQLQLLIEARKKIDAKQ